MLPNVERNYYVEIIETLKEIREELQKLNDKLEV